MNAESVKNEVTEAMTKAVDYLLHEFAAVRTGKASPALVENLDVNVAKEKKLTNMRASGSDEKMKIAPPLKHTLEEALEYIQADEYVEVTPKSIRLRKIYLNENERKRFGGKQ